MPPNIDPNNNEAKHLWRDAPDYKYTYPRDLDLDPKSDFHAELVGKIKNRAQLSQSVMSSRYPDWRAQDDMLNVFISLDEKEAMIKARDPRKPVSVVIPESYAILRTLMTYVCSGLLNDYEIFKYAPVGSEDVVGVALLEQNIALQAMRARMLLNIYTACRCNYVHGFGAVSPQWRQKRGVVRKAKRDNGYKAAPTISTEKNGLKWEGNILQNIDPYCYFPDPSVPIQDVQEGEFVGWVTRTNRMSLLTEERTGDTLFNVKYLTHCSGTSSIFRESFQRRTEDDVHRDSTNSHNPVDVLYEYINLIPSEWNLGSGEYPEKWLFALAGDSLIIAAEPVAYEHGEYPIGIVATDFDGFGVTPISRIEATHGLQVVINWLFNSHMKNVRKNMNDRLVINPKMVDLRTVVDGEGDIILRPDGNWAPTDIDKAVIQLRTTDVTARNIGESAFVGDMMKRMSGATDSLDGMQRKTSERVSATEVNANKNSSLSQIGMDIRLISTMLMGPVGYQLACNTQQFMSQAVQLKIAGRYVDELREEFGDKEWVTITPEDLIVQFDAISYDASMALGQNPQDWLMLWQILSTSEPDIRADFEMKNIFRYIARLLGAKNISDFVKKGGSVQPTVMPDAQVAQQMQAGNIQAIPQLGGMLG